ncbi:MAG: hypothetical protein JWR70_3318 [Modestobacter sp.]|nr:hypothetical protein [Modestobacter sp.]
MVGPSTDPCPSGRDGIPGAELARLGYGRYAVPVELDR